MGKGASRLELIAQQNELLKEQNELLREQNELMKRSTSASLGGEREVFIENIDRDEMRSGFLVTSHRKKLWNVQIGLINEFARICKKYNLRWFAFYGTLLGAARHKGFIPWDDDVDVVMLRPEYEKFKKVAPYEIQYPYFFDAWFNYKLESQENLVSPNYGNFQLVTKEQEKNFAGWYPFWPILKLRDSRTSMIQWNDRRHVNQGIWLDIFPLDPVPPFTDKQQEMNYELARELMLAVALPNITKKRLEQKERFILSADTLENFVKLSHNERALRFEDFMLKKFFKSERITEFRNFVVMGQKVSYDIKCFDDIVYLPFEKIEIPAPRGYKKVLEDEFGDWHKLVYTPSHTMDYSADIPFQNYFSTVAKKSPIKKNDRVVGFVIEDSKNS